MQPQIKAVTQCLCHFSVFRSVLSHPTSYRPRLLLQGRPGSGQSSHLAPAVLHALEKFTVYTLDMAVLFGASATAPEETCAQVIQTSIKIKPNKWLVLQLSSCILKMNRSSNATTTYYKKALLLQFCQIQSWMIFQNNHGFFPPVLQCWCILQQFLGSSSCVFLNTSNK